MTRIFVIGDLHIGHQGIIKLRKNILPGWIVDTYDYAEFIIENWNRSVTKRDRVIIFGDFLFHKNYGHYVDRLEGYKILIGGNHDCIHVRDYVNEVHGAMKRKGIWLSHVPIHPDELFGKPNAHGHSHYKNIPDPRYLNLCPENVGWDMLEWDFIVNHFKEKGIIP